MKAVTNGYLVLPERVIGCGTLVFDEDEIVWAGDAADYMIPRQVDVIDAEGAYIVPGFVDIHCHGGGGFRCENDPVPMAEFHLRHGTTSVLCSIAYGLDHQGLLDAVERITDAWKTMRPGSIAGIHMEAPYIAPGYGARSKGRGIYPVIREEYEQLEEKSSGCIRQWTFSPELDDLEEFADFARSKGIALAMGHSAAGPQEVLKFYRKGARIVTHLFNATGCSAAQESRGTRDPWFDECCMILDGMYAEVIPDKEGMHVRPQMLSMAFKTMGEQYLCIITDATGETIAEDGRDIRINQQGELAGSKMTMDLACKNFMHHTGADIRQVCRMACANPARAVNIYDRVGSLEAGKRADFLITDEYLQPRRIFLCGQEVIK